jgi:hypothetical protein
MGWIAEELWFDSGQGPEIFHLSSTSRSGVGSKSTGVKTQELELNTSINYGSEESVEMNGTLNVNR